MFTIVGKRVRLKSECPLRRRRAAHSRAPVRPTTLWEASGRTLFLHGRDSRLSIRMLAQRVSSRLNGWTRNVLRYIIRLCGLGQCEGSR